MMISLVCVALGHLAMKTIVPQLIVNLVAVALIGGVFFWVLFQKKDLFSFLLIVLVCSQYRIADNQGGVFNLVTFVVLGAYLIQYKVRETGARQDVVIGIALFALFAFNAMGVMFRSPVSFYLKILELCAFTGFLLAFYAASMLRLTEARVRTLVLVVSLVMLWDFLVSMNQYYLFLAIDIPLLGLTENTLYGSTNSFGTFGSASNNAQFALIIFAFLLPLICATVTRERLKLNALYIIFVAVVCCFVIILANMRAAAIQAAIVTMIYLAMFSVFYRRSFKYSKYLTRFSVLLLISLVYLGVWIGLRDITAEFQAVAISSTEDIVSGQSLNRMRAWQAALELLARGSWWIGYGHGVAESNMAAWGGQVSGGIVYGGGHLHNLYFALPTLYGWFGSIAYLVLFFTVPLRLYRSVRRFSFDRFAVIVALGFLVSSIFYLFDEVKSGNGVQYINYPMIMFIWFGFGLAAVRTIRFDLAREKVNAPKQSSAAAVRSSPAYLIES